jgi:Holliday junction resolvase RusA-like endonuclease
VVNLLNLAAEIKKLLEPYQGPENLSKIYKKPDKKQRLGWKRTKDDIQNLRERIAGCLNELQLAMAADTR